MPSAGGGKRSAGGGGHGKETIDHRPILRPEFVQRVFKIFRHSLTPIKNFPTTIFHSSFFIFHSSPSTSSAPAVYTVAYASDEFALRAILDSQRSDGSWSNDYLTMQNAAALRRAHDEASQIAYKRAVRYLRTKGLGPISDAELRERSDKTKLPKSDWFLI